MKSKVLMLVFIGTLIVGTIFLINFYFQSNTNQDQIVSQSYPAKRETGHKWFSNVHPEEQATSSRLYGIAAELNGKTISQYVKSLYDAANSGDVKAAYNIYLAETVCTSLSQRQREVANIAVNTEQNYVEALQTVVKNSRTVCADYNASPRERIYYLHAAAKGGMSPHY